MPKPRRSQFNTRNKVVKGVGVAAAVASVAAPMVAKPVHEVGVKQGSWRWSVKTMADTDATKVSTSAPQVLKVEDFADFAAPDEHLLPSTPRGAGPEEFKEYTIDGYIVKYKGEDDGDYHLLISNDGKDTTHLLGVEVVRPDYAKDSKIFGVIQSVRSDFENAVLSLPATGTSYKTLKTPFHVRVTGVGFWDETHGQHGLPTGFELHPVVKFENK